MEIRTRRPPDDDETTIVDPPDIILPPDGPGRRKVYVDGIEATIVTERVQYLDEKASSSPSLCVTSPRGR